MRNFEFGEPASAVCRAARDYDAELVVVGAHRYGRLARVLGTTAAAIVDGIDRPLLVVRPMPGAAERAVDGERRLLAGSILRREHARLEEVYGRLLASYRDDDWENVRAQWNIFETALVAHLDFEETRVFPEFRTADAAEVARLQAEHAELRKLLGALGVRIDLHAASPQDVEELVVRLRAHGAREEQQLHVWMDRNMSTEGLGWLSPAA